MIRPWDLDKPAESLDSIPKQNLYFVLAKCLQWYGGFNLKVHFFDVLKLMHLIILSVFCIPKFLSVSRLALPGPKANLFY